jgi:hypothetical protein
MTIADRKEQQAVMQGSFDHLSGKGKPLSDDPNRSQAHIGALPKNMEGRAEAEMRRAAQAGLLSNLAGEGKPLSDEHQALRAAGGGGGAQSAQEKIQKHVISQGASRSSKAP